MLSLIFTIVVENCSVNICDMCCRLSHSNITSYADDSAAYISADSVIDESIKKIQNDFVYQFYWFPNNLTKVNKKQTLGNYELNLKEKPSFDKKPWLNENMMENILFRHICQKSHRKSQTNIALKYM